ncbi:hypothetical protein JCM1393_06360 [Clostridium carnis]
MNAIKLYRVARKLHEYKLEPLAWDITKINNFWHNSYIPHTAKIGKDSYFGYGGIGVVIHKKAIIGENYVLGKGITIGGRRDYGVPPMFIFHQG